MTHWSLPETGSGSPTGFPDWVSHKRAVVSYEAHPLRRYFDRGLNVVLNTDNRLMSGTTLTDEYLHAARSLDFTFDELARVARNGFASAFLPWEERSKLLADFDADLARLRSGAAA